MIGWFFRRRGEGVADPTAVGDAPDAVFIDVRTPEEYAGGHLEGARNLDIQGAAFQRQMLRLPRDAQYVVYCRSGARSARAVAFMRKSGFANVVDGGRMGSAARRFARPVVVGAAPG